MAPKSSTLNGQCYDIYLFVQELRQKLRHNSNKLYWLRQKLHEKEMDIIEIDVKISSIDDVLDPNNTVTIWALRMEKMRIYKKIDILRMHITRNMEEERDINKKILDLEMKYDVGNV